MNDNLKNYLDQVKAYLFNLSTGKKIAAAGFSLLLVGAIATLVIAVRHDPYQLLFSELQPEDARNVAKALSEKNIPYQVSPDNTALYVPASQVAPARMTLAKEGLPGQEVVGFEKFDGSTIGMSSYVQRIQYIRAVQGELTRSIQRLNAVKSARVHISMPPKKTFLEEEDPPKGSVVVELKPGQALTKSEVNGIAHLVSSAVEGLKVSEVTIVDTHGNFLHRPEEAGNNAISNTLLEEERSIEAEYEKRIEDILTPVVGFGKVRAKVTAEVDPAHLNTTEETYDPDKAVVKSSVKMDENQSGSRPNPIGIPGSRSNLPGTDNQNNTLPMATTSSEKNTQNNNYSIPRKVSVIDKPSGSIKRLTVAVVVDGVYNKGADGKTETFAPRSEEELNRLKDLVGNAVGFDSSRRDSITISSLPFRNSEFNETVEAPNGPWWQKDDLMKHALRNGLLAVILISFILMVIRPFLKWALTADLSTQTTTYPKTVTEIEAEAVATGAAMGAGSPGTPKDELEPIEKREESELVKKIQDKLLQAPKKGVRIVQDWLEEEMKLVPDGEEAA